MRGPDARPAMTVEEYLRFDEGSPARHEYVAGEVYAMSGVTFRHNRNLAEPRRYAHLGRR